MNPIESLWGILARAVYKEFWQFDDAESLKEAIVYEWEKIEISVLRSLVRFMKKRCIDVLDKRGGPIKY